MDANIEKGVKSEQERMYKNLEQELQNESQQRDRKQGSVKQRENEF